MTPITIRWDRRAVNELRTLSPAYRQRVYNAVGALRDDPLRGSPLAGEWRGLRRLRVGTVRVIYGFDGRELLVSIVRVGRRGHVYRKS